MNKTLTISLAVVMLASASAGAGAAPRPMGDKDRDGVPNVVDPHDDRWDPNWGAAVKAPRGWNKAHKWNHHVSLCRAKYPSYDAHKDRYKVRSRWLRCTLY